MECCLILSSRVQIKPKSPPTYIFRVFVVIMYFKVLRPQTEQNQKHIIYTSINDMAQVSKVKMTET
jgi:preprotein translocase subunit YajC